MKTFTVTFHFPDGATAGAVARFATLPGRAPVAWSGEAQRLLATVPAPYNKELISTAYAEMFVKGMRGLGQRAGAEVEIREEGEWIACEE